MVAGSMAASPGPMATPCRKPVPGMPPHRHTRPTRPTTPLYAYRPQASDCLLQGSLQQLGAACDSIPQCVALRVKPGKLLFGTLGMSCHRCGACAHSPALHVSLT